MNGPQLRIADRRPWVVALLPCGCAAASVGATGAQGAAPPQGVAAEAGARSYFAPPAEGAAEESVTDPLQRSLLESVAAAARGLGRAPPENDARLGAVARALAEGLGDDGMPGLELQEHLLGLHGIGEPAPYLMVLRVAARDETIRARLARDLPAVLAAGHYRRVAVGVARSWFQRSVVVALQEVDVELLPIRRHLALGASALVAGRLLEGLRDPRLLVAPPAGDVREIPLRGGPEGFRASFACDGAPGRYQLELTGTGATGKRPVAIFPVFCGVGAPAAFLGASVRLESADVVRLEASMLELVNRDRAAAGASPVVWDAALARVARAHSDEMAARGATAHVSATTGNAADRVSRAGILAVVVMENVARAGSVADAERSFMSSPGHRANVLDRTAVRLGVGIVISGGQGGAPSIYVTQLFAR